MRITPYADAEAARWDEFVAGATAATFLHTRRFLSYHGGRFRDLSLMFEDERGALVGVLPAAEDRSDPRRVVSHPGITYGGLLHRGELLGEATLEAFEAARAHYRALGYEALRYKAVPHVYHARPAADDLYALFRLGAARYRCDLSCAVDLALRPAPSQRRRRGAKKAAQRGVRIEEGPQLIPAIWGVLEDNLGRKYDLRPVHSAGEIALLHERFPREIEFVAGVLEGQTVAGVVLFNTPLATHAQYTAASRAGYDASALDAVFEHCLAAAAARGARFFDFGNSNEEEGRYLNPGLYRFKTEFGAGGVVHEFYELPLKAASDT
ncbi:MAG TPA: GNAT family N-acetyltransferase [Pyrinomonadaceae bacterium]|jgi:hypothetical protein